MPRIYQHLNEEERDTLAILFNRGRSLQDIARFLGRSVSTLSREIRRNTGPAGYRPHSADKAARRRFQESHRRPRLPDPALRATVAHLVRRGWSPEIIAGRLKRDAQEPVISHEAIYQWIYAEARPLIPSLVRGHRRRRHRLNHPWPKVLIPQRISVQERPPEANTRQQPGHWEADLLLSAGHTALQVAVERQSRLTRLRKIPRKTAHASSQALHQVLGPIPALLRRSITYDNGLENVLHLDLNAALGLRSFFCQPYHSWEKGTVENTNGLIRRFLPKRVNFDMIQDKHVQRIEAWLNARPRKCLQFQSSAEAFHTLTVALAG